MLSMHRAVICTPPFPTHHSAKINGVVAYTWLLTVREKAVLTSEEGTAEPGLTYRRGNTPATSEKELETKVV